MSFWNRRSLLIAGTLILSGAVGGYWYCTFSEWRLLRVLDGHKGGVVWMEFSPDGGTLAVGCNDGKVKLWDPRTGKLERTLFAHEDIFFVAFSGNGKTLFTFDYFNGTAKFWDTDTWTIRSGINLGGLADATLPPYSGYFAAVFGGGTTKL